ncbi:MAG: hypothetical protein JWP34_4694 [Massilia sp.]|nr:hypothetical protein [Massilia sp.]
MDGKQCDGWVHSLKGQTVCFTGKVLIDGEWTVQKRCGEMAKLLGAKSWKPDFSRKVTAVVHGDLASQIVTDSHRQYSQKLLGAEQERDQGRHVHIVDADGFADLLKNLPARCRELRRTTSGNHLLVLPRPGDGILGGPLQRHQAGRHKVGALTIDLNRLDEGTEAHEATVAALIAYLALKQVEVCTHARNAPRFDAGWSRGEDVFIAEVKSLTDTSEDQQIRLGIGQILDYIHQLQGVRTFGQVRPVLVLEKRPADPRWSSLAEANGILLTWAPEFVGC